MVHNRSVLAGDQRDDGAFRRRAHSRHLVLGRQQRWDEADRVFAEAVSLAQGMPYPYAEGRILYEYGRLHVQRNKPKQARERMVEALAVFRRLGASKDTERTEQALAALDRSAGAPR